MISPSEANHVGKQLDAFQAHLDGVVAGAPFNPVILIPAAVTILQLVAKLPLVSGNPMLLTAVNGLIALLQAYPVSAPPSPGV